MRKGLKAGFVFGAIVVLAMTAMFIITGAGEAPNPKDVKRAAALAESEAQYQRDKADALAYYGFESTSRGIRTIDGSRIHWRALDFYKVAIRSADERKAKRNATIEDEYWGSLTFEEMERAYHQAVGEYWDVVHRHHDRDATEWDESYDPAKRRMEYVERRCLEFFPDRCR